MALRNLSEPAVGGGPYVKFATIYFPLEPNQTRFLTIFPASSIDDDIYSELIRVSLDDEVVSGYEALSYSWGSEMLTHSMPVNDCPLKVVANLLDAIRHLRGKEGKRAVWIDAVCINQRDMAERGRQVLYMGKIYSTVRQVVIWVVMKNPMVL
jgi:Heterokaryon incompatibility protein (HET)